VLERRAPPTFDVLIEIQTRDEFTIHADITEAVDTFLRGFPLPPEIRIRDEEARSGWRKYRRRPCHTRLAQPHPERGRSSERGSAPRADSCLGRCAIHFPGTSPALVPFRCKRVDTENIVAAGQGLSLRRGAQPADAVAKRLGVPAIVVRTIDEADALITLRAHYRDHQATIVDAEHRACDLCAAVEYRQPDRAIPDRPVQFAGEITPPPKAITSSTPRRRPSVLC